MANPFTPEQISQILEEFFKVVGTRQYIGARYVPIFGHKDETSIEWDNSAPYEPLTIVLYQGNSYTSRQYVPVGVEITNQEFWAITGNYNAQVEMYRRETAAAREIADNALTAANNAQTDIDTLLPKADFSAENTVKNYIDTSISNLDRVKPFVFDTVADMQAASEMLYVGAICHTNGFHSINDGGAAYYVITETGIANNMDVIACDDLFANLISDKYITPEMFGAYGDGSHDDTSIIKYVVGLSKNIRAEKNYLISDTVNLVANRNVGKKYYFKNVTYIGESHAFEINGYSGILEINNLSCTVGNGIVIGNAVTWDWIIDINEIYAPSGYCIKYIGYDGGVSQTVLNANLFVYGTNGIIFDTTNYWVGQNTINSVRLLSNTDNAGYGITCDCSNYSVTGLTLNDVSLEGCHGGIEILNVNGAKSLETLNCFGLRISELTNTGYKFIKATGNGVIKGVIYADMILNFDTSYDFSGYIQNMNLVGLSVFGRIAGRNTNFRKAILKYNKFVPELPETIGTINADTEFDDTSYPPTFCYTTAAHKYTLNASEPFDGKFIFMSTVNGSEAVINGRSYTINSNSGIAISNFVSGNRCVEIIPDIRIY